LDYVAVDIVMKTLSSYLSSEHAL